MEQRAHLYTLAGVCALPRAYLRTGRVPRAPIWRLCRNKGLHPLRRLRGYPCTPTKTVHPPLVSVPFLRVLLSYPGGDTHSHLLWDEAANTGQVPNLEKLVAVIRSREISLCLLYQQLAQCKAIYDKNAETILGNMDSVLFLGGREASTIKEISENWLGKATISMQTEGRSRGQSESYSQNTQRLGRELMTPSELATMPGDRCILQLRGLPPFYSKKYDLKQHPNYKYTAEADKVKNAFDLNSLVTRRMDKLNPNETYTVYKVDVPDEALTGEDEDILNYDDLDDPDAFV